MEETSVGDGAGSWQAASVPVAGRTVTETYVARRGLPCARLGQNSSPLFLLDDVIIWLRAQNVAAREGEGP